MTKQRKAAKAAFDKMQVENWHVFKLAWDAGIAWKEKEQYDYVWCADCFATFDGSEHEECPRCLR